MKYAELIATLIKSLLAIAGFFLVKKSGADSQKLESTQKELEAVQNAKIIKDNAVHDSDMSDKLRDRFNG